MCVRVCRLGVQGVCVKGVGRRPLPLQGGLCPLSCFLLHSAPPEHRTQDQVAGEGLLSSSFEQSQQEAGTGSHKERCGLQGKRGEAWNRGFTGSRCSWGYTPAHSLAGHPKKPASPTCPRPQEGEGQTTTTVKQQQGGPLEAMWKQRPQRETRGAVTGMMALGGESTGNPARPGEQVYGRSQFPSADLGLLQFPQLNSTQTTWPCLRCHQDQGERQPEDIL